MYTYFSDVPERATDATIKNVERIRICGANFLEEKSENNTRRLISVFIQTLEYRDWHDRIIVAI